MLSAQYTDRILMDLTSNIKSIMSAKDTSLENILAIC